MAIYCSCILCHSQIEFKQLTNHYNSKACRKIFEPKIDRRKGKAWNSGLTKATDPRLAAMASSIAKLHELGVYDDAVKQLLAASPKCHNAETKAKLSAIGLANKYQRVCKSSHKFIDKRGREFIFDSSWEDALANRLDSLDIVWTRPDPIEYKLNGKIRNYFPDFYLPAYDLYLDPKNPYCKDQQKDKLEIVTKIINLVILTSLSECNEWSPRQESNLDSKFRRLV